MDSRMGASGWHVVTMSVNYDYVLEREVQAATPPPNIYK